MRVLRLCVLVVLAAAFPAAAAAAHAQAPGELLRLEQSIDAMGTTYVVTIYGYDREQMLSAVEAATDELERLDRELSNYRPESEWSKVNRMAAERPVKVSAELFGLLQKCVDVSRQSEGTFDITVGPLMRVWGFYRGTGHLPGKGQVAAALERVGYRNIILDPAGRTVRFGKPGVEIDPGGIGKGYAVDRIISVLKDNGIRSALVTAGGSSIYALGSPDGGSDGWPVKIRDPKNPDKTVADLQLKDESMSTSGSYEKFFEADGKIYSHIMDPRTGYPAKGMLSVSVVAPATLDSEAWTKPYFILGRQWTANHKPKNFRVFLCEDRADLRCEWLQ